MSVAIPSLLPATVDEDAVRRLCGAAFAEADTLQRAGHVTDATAGTDGLSGNVRGVWRRIDRVTIGIRAGRLHPTCTRDGGTFCRHAGALLLQVLREPLSIVETNPTTERYALVAYHRALAFRDTAQTGQPHVVAIPDEIETPQAELARLLEYDTMAHLREIARWRGLRPAGSKKADVIASLSEALAEPASIDAAVAALGANDRRTIDAVSLTAGETVARWQAVTQVYHLLGGTGEPPRTAHDAGLVLLSGYSTADANHIVPRAVAARLPALEGLADRATSAPNSTRSASSDALGIVELLQIVSLALLTGGPVKIQPVATTPSIQNPPSGFRFTSGAPSIETLQNDGVLLAPQRFLVERDARRLVERTGQPAEIVDFAVRLMLALGVAEAGPDVTARRDRLQALLDLSPADRLERITRAWLAIAGPPAIASALQPPGRLRLRWRLTYGYAYWQDPLQPALAAAARLVTRLGQRLPPDVWYDLGSFCATVERLAPHVAPRLTHLRNQETSHQEGLSFVWVTDRGRDERLALRAPEDWSRFVSSLVFALLSGPLRWLGMTEAIVNSDRRGMLRAISATSSLASTRTGVDGSASISARLAGDLTVLVPAGTADVSVHGRLARAGELIEATSAGLRYRITPSGVHALFESGTTGPEFTRFLTELIGQDLPTSAQKMIDGWWSGYGAIRLYDELTVIELGDDLLQRELRVATSLDSAIVHIFSPRLIAIDPTRAEDLIAELTLRGYAPRVVEEG